MSDQVVALFCGAGGLSLGFSNAGLQPEFAAEIDEAACSTYSANQKIEAKKLDLSDESPQTFALLAPYRSCLAVVGGPPCQGFSTAGARKVDDPRNKLVFSYLQIVDFLKPRWFLFENVEGILTADDGESIHALLTCFIRRGYTVRVDKVNFAAYGLPQSRKRVLIMGNNIGVDFDIPEPTNSFTSGKHNSFSCLPHSPTLAEAIADLPSCSESNTFLKYGKQATSDYAHRMREGNVSGGVTLHFSNSGDVERMKRLSPGQTMRDLPEEYWHPSFKRRANRRVMDGTPTENRGGAPSGLKRLVADRCSLTVTSAATREFVHPSEDRPLTLREAARLQSFPDRYEFTGGPTAIAKQIGNAVPPLAAEVFARHIAYLDGQIGTRRSRIARPGLIGFRLTEASAMSPALNKTDALLRSLTTADKKPQRLLWQDEDETDASPLSSPR